MQYTASHDGFPEVTPSLELFQVVRLRRDSPEDALAAGTVGAVVDLLKGDGAAYEIEVVDESGRTVFLGPVSSDLLEPVRGHRDS